MTTRLILRLCGLALFGLLASACTLLPLSPSLSLGVQSEYTSSAVSIPYSFQTLSHNSDGSAHCSYTLTKYDPTVGGYTYVDGNTDTTLQDKGTLSFALSTLLGTSTGGPPVDGLYELTFSVLSDNFDQSGNRIPFSFLTQTKGFTVHTSTGPVINESSPPIVNVNQTAALVTLAGDGFTSTGSMNQPGVVSGLTYISSNAIQISVNAGTLTAGTALPLTYVDSQGVTSAVYNLPVVGNVTVSGTSPSSGSDQNSSLSLTVNGSYLGYWSTVTITDAGGHTSTMKIQNVPTSYGSNSIVGEIDLTPLTTLGPAIVTISNPDGSTATTSFTVTN